jgi:hypothetical protein
VKARKAKVPVIVAKLCCLYSGCFLYIQAYGPTHAAHRGRARRGRRPFMLHIYAALKEEERYLISDRTRAALRYRRAA